MYVLSPSQEERQHILHDLYLIHLQDSRYWGLLPDDYIVGIVKGILSSRDPYTSEFFKLLYLKVVNI